MTKHGGKACHAVMRRLRNDDEPGGAMMPCDDETTTDLAQGRKQPMESTMVIQFSSIHKRPFQILPTPSPDESSRATVHGELSYPKERFARTDF